MLLLMVNEWCACFTDVFTTTLIMLSVCVKVLMVFQQPLTPIMLNFRETKLFSAAGWGFCNHVGFWLFPHIFIFPNSGVLVVFDCDYDDWTIDNGLSTIIAECISLVMMMMMMMTIMIVVIMMIVGSIMVFPPSWLNAFVCPYFINVLKSSCSS